MYGEDVRAVQNKLNSLGHNAGTVDGYYGNGTKAAVIRFQQNVGITADGMVGPTTWNKLFSSSSGDRTLKVTSPLMYGQDIKNVQSRLNSLKYNAGTVDGYYGNGTANAVRDFQGINGLSVDGMVGPETRSKLFSSTAKPKPSGGTIGSEIAAVRSNSPLDSLYMRVNRGGTLYVSDFVMHADGYYGQRKRWFKNDNWKEGSTGEIFYGIADANGGYNSMIQKIRDAVSISNLFPSFDSLKDDVLDTLKNMIDGIIAGSIRPRENYDLNKLDELTIEELMGAIAYMFDNPQDTINRFEIADIEVEKEMKMYQSMFGENNNDLISKDEFTRDPRFVLPTLVAIRNLIAGYQIFQKIQGVVDIVWPTGTYVYNTLRAVHHFNKI